MSNPTTRLALPIRALALTVVPGALCLAPAAFAKTQAGLDVSASGNVASNPDMLSNAHAGVSVVATFTPWLRVDDSVSHVSVLGNVQVEKYTSRYGTNTSGWASVDGSHGLSEYVTVSGNLAYRRTNRILDDFLSRGAGSVNGGLGQVELPIGQLPDVSFGALRTKNESYEGNLNVSILASERGSLNLGGGVRLARYDTLTASSMNEYSGSVGYSHRLSERTSVNVSGGYSRFDFLGTDIGDGWTVNPRVGASQQFGDTLTLSGSIGASISRSRRPDNTIRGFSVLSGEVMLCKDADRTKYCLSAQRSAEAAALGGASAVNQVKLNFATTLGEVDSLTADAFYARYDSPTVTTLLARASEFIGASAAYSHNFADRRLSAVVSPSVVRLTDVNGSKMNFQLRLSLRYSFGRRS